jgi:hypothetical protein
VRNFPSHRHRVGPFGGGAQTNGPHMNQIIYIVGLVVIVLVIIGFFGLR